MKKRAAIKKLSLPTTVAISAAAMIALLLLFCATCATLILNGTLKNTDFEITSRIMITLSSFVSAKIATRNNSKFLVTTITTVFITLLMLCCAIVLKTNVVNLITVVLFSLLGAGVAFLTEKITPKKSRFQKKHYR